MREYVLIKLSLRRLNWTLGGLNWGLRLTYWPSKMNSCSGIWPTYDHQLLMGVTAYISPVLLQRFCNRGNGSFFTLGCLLRGEVEPLLPLDALDKGMMPYREAGEKGMGIGKKTNRECCQSFYTCQASSYPSFKEIITFSTKPLPLSSFHPHLPRKIKK